MPLNHFTRDVWIPEFWVRICIRVGRVAFASTSANLSRLASASALPATLRCLKYTGTQGQPLTLWCVQKNCKCNWYFVVLLLLESRNVALKEFFSQEASVSASTKTSKIASMTTSTKCLQMHILSPHRGQPPCRGGGALHQ